MCGMGEGRASRWRKEGDLLQLITLLEYSPCSSLGELVIRIVTWGVFDLSFEAGHICGHKLGHRDGESFVGEGRVIDSGLLD